MGRKRLPGAFVATRMREQVPDAIGARTGASVGRCRSPTDADLPASPSPDSGLVPTETVSRRVNVGPVATLRHQEFSALPLRHAATVSAGEDGPRIVATLANGSAEPWGYRVPRGPAPFAGGRASGNGTELRTVPAEATPAVTDGVLRPGESIRSTVAVSPLPDDAGWPDGEYAFLQPLTVWTDERAYSYNWRLALGV